MSEKYINHLKSIQEIIVSEQNRCLRASDIAQCAPSKEFKALVDAMLHNMVNKAENLPDKYYESLLQGTSPKALEQMLDQYRESLKDASKKPIKSTHEETI